MCSFRRLRVRRMLPWGHAGAGAVLCVGIMVLVVPAAAVAAEPALDQADAAGQRALVDWSHAMRLHGVIERWLAEGGPPGDDEAGDDAATPIEVSGVAGVFVTLRWSGVTPWRGQWTRAGLLDELGERRADDPPEARLEDLGQVVDLVAAAKIATRAALRKIKAQAAESRDAAPAAENDDPQRGQLAPANIMRRLLVDVQIARTPEQIVLPAQAPEGAALHRFVPGHHGLILTSAQAGAGSRASGWLWPGEALARNLPPNMQLISVLQSAGLQREQLASVGRPGGLRLYRFEVIHFVRPERDRKPVRLVRGNEVLPAIGLSRLAITALGRRLANHLASRQRENGTMAGTYHPTSNRYDPPDASSADQALAAYALARWLKLQTHIAAGEGAADADQADQRLAVSRATRHLAWTPRVIDEPGQAATAALTMMALIDAPHLADRKVDRAMLRRRILNLQNDDGSFRSAAGRGAAHTLVLTALVELYDQTRAPDLEPHIRSACAHLAAAAEAKPEDEPNDLGTLPWLARATADLQRLKIGAGDAQVAAVAPEVLIHAASRLLKKQITANAKPVPPDVIGGFDLEQGTRPATAQPDADWRTAHGLMFLAVLLRQEEWRNDEAPNVTDMDLVLRCSLASRFLAQLAFAESGCYYIGNPSDVLGGMRQRLWRNDVGVVPTAMALLAVAELEQSLEYFQRQVDGR